MMQTRLGLAWRGRAPCARRPSIKIYIIIEIKLNYTFQCQTIRIALPLKSSGGLARRDTWQGNKEYTLLLYSRAPFGTGLARSTGSIATAPCEESRSRI